jgi:PadR family transcriptional regulator
MARDQSRLDVLQGTLDLLILRALRGGAMHGWAISERIQLISQDVLQVNQGSLYPALHRLERRHWIKAEWGVSELGRRARFYSLTAAGRKQLEREAENWGKLSEAIARVLSAPGARPARGRPDGVTCGKTLFCGYVRCSSGAKWMKSCGKNSTFTSKCKRGKVVDTRLRWWKQSDRRD